MFSIKDILDNPSITKIDKTPVINNAKDACSYIKRFFYNKYHQVSATHPLLHKEKEHFLKLDAAINNPQTSLRDIVLLLRDTITALEDFETTMKYSKYQATRYQSALNFWGTPYKPLIDLCKELLSIFAINHFRNELICIKIESMNEDERNNQGAWNFLRMFL